jgi:hypothetical protein
MVVVPFEQKMGYAIGYVDAMHQLCIKCHEEILESHRWSYSRSFAECALCHRESDLTLFQKMRPYGTGIPEG